MRVLVVDDESAVRESISLSLGFEGYDVQVAADGIEALEVVARGAPDVVVLDVQMPRLDGLGVCRRLRADGNRIPILMLTAREGTSDRVLGLDAGADDYLVKPFALEELLARLRALLRRAQPDVGAEKRLTFADLSLDRVTREVTRAGVPLDLTRTEFALLELLLSHPREVLARPQILQAVWGYDFGSSSNSLDVYVSYLRHKTEAGGETRLVQTVRGVGFVMREY
ncbi:MAG: response regulator transcription factor [Cellulomonas sp.]